MSRRGLTLVAGGILWAGCRVSPPEPVRPVNLQCLLARGSAADTAIIGITGEVRSLREARPRTDAARVLSRHLYETLIEIDCTGQVRPGLAASWRRARGGLDWVFELREGASFTDGAAVTAGHLEAAWRGRSRGAISPVIESVTAPSERELRVTMARPYSSVPRLFADAELAVRAHRGGTGAWPLGTLGYGVHAVTDTAVTLVPVGAMGGDDLPALRLVFGARDLRDLVDLEADLIVTPTRGVVEYARSASGYRAIPLPWSRVYGLLMGTDPPSAVAWRETAEALSADLVGSEWRPPQAPHWWEELVRCAGSAPGVQRAAIRSDRLVYRSDDARARDLAERLVALRTVVPLHGAEVGAATAVGLSDAEFARAMMLGSERAYIVDLATRVLDPCLTVLDISTSAPWIETRDVTRALIPLAETRSTALVRDGAGPIMLGWDGLPFFRAIVGRSP